MNARERIPYPENAILVVDDEQYIQINIRNMLLSNGITNVVTCGDGVQMLKQLDSRTVDILFLDLTLPGMSGLDLLPQIRENYPDILVVVITGHNDAPTAVECMKQGVFDYLVKAIDEGRLMATVRRAIEMTELRRENRRLRNHLVDMTFEFPEALRGIVFEDTKMRSLFLYLDSIARSSQTVLITGETGVGKDVMARALHLMSGRQGEMVSVNIAGLDDGMFTDTLFGHVSGAYTGAQKDRIGLIGKAKGGTLFLDEIGDLPPNTQVKLLRLLESGEYYPLGSDLARRTDARIVVATNRDLSVEMERGTFRKDLFYRLQTHHVKIPPLRERPSDIPVFLSRFVAEARLEYGKEITNLDPRIPRAMGRYPFPGNIRELKAMVFDAVSRCTGGALTVESFPLLAGARSRTVPDVYEGRSDSSGGDPGTFRLVIEGRFPTLTEAVEYLIREALVREAGNQARASRLLGISPPALNKRLRKEDHIDRDRIPGSSA